MQEKYAGVCGKYCGRYAGGMRAVCGCLNVSRTRILPAYSPHTSAFSPHTGKDHRHLVRIDRSPVMRHHLVIRRHHLVIWRHLVRPFGNGRRHVVRIQRGTGNWRHLAMWHHLARPVGKCHRHLVSFTRWVYGIVGNQGQNVMQTGLVVVSRR